MKTNNFHLDRAVDVYRGRTGATIAGVDSIGGSSIDLSAPLADGEVLVYDAITDTWVPTDIATALDVAGTYLRRLGGGWAVVYVTTASGSSLTLDLSLANVFDVTLTANCTIAFSNPPASGVEGSWTLILRQGGTGSYTVTWPASFKWQSATGTNTGSAPTLWTAVGAQDVIVVDTLDGGTSYGAADESHVGTVTSVAVTVPAEFSVSGSPVTSSGTIAITKANESANTFWAGPTTGAAAAPTFRAIVAADIPAGVVGSDHEHVMDCLFSGDGSTTAFPLPVAPVDAYSVAAYVSGVLTEVTLSGTMLDTATFGSAPASATNNIRFDIVAAVL